MHAADASEALDLFLTGHLSRRQLISRLMALGAVAAGVGSSAKAGQPGDAAPAPAVEPTFKAESVDHLAINVTDIPRSRDWYVKHLGLRVASQDRNSAFLYAGKDFVALFRADKPGLHHYSFGIADYNQQAAAQRLREAGLVPKLRGARIYFDDPDGIEVQVSRQPV